MRSPSAGPDLGIRISTTAYEGKGVKYFTTAWWRTGCADRTPIIAYREHFQRISDVLPASVVAFEASHTLHDARLETVTVNVAERSVALALSAWDRSFAERVRHHILFLDVAAFEQQLPTGRDIQSELGDLGYWEYGIASPDVELRLLFASGAEFRIVFGDARFTQDPGA